MTRWRNAWDNAKCDLKDDYGNPYEGELSNPGKALNLLAHYAGFSKTMLTLAPSTRWSDVVRFFFLSVQHNQHRAHVKEAIRLFYGPSSLYALNENYHAVDFILACVKAKIGLLVIDPQDDLSKILDVICEKTGVDYGSLDAHAIIRLYRAGHTPMVIATAIPQASLVIEDMLDDVIDVPTANLYF